MPLFEEQMRGDKPEPIGMAWLAASCALKNAIESNTDLLIEYYHRVCFFINKEAPKDGWKKSPAVDRAEAKLRLWIELFRD